MVDDISANHGRTWGFPLNRIRTPVELCYAALDQRVTVAMGRHLADAVPGSVFHLVEGVGHLWPLVHLSEVLPTVPATSDHPRGEAVP